MYKHVLIATDGSDLAQKAVEQGLALAKTVGASAAAVYVTPPWTAVVSPEIAIGLSPDSYETMAEEDAQAVLGRVSASAEAAGVPCELVHVHDRLPAEGIIDTAAGRHADLIVMASHGRSGLARVLLGSQASSVVARSAVPVLVCR